MTVATTEREGLTLTVSEEIRIDASLEASFTALLDQIRLTAVVVSPAAGRTCSPP
jgi:hypothetical protein